MEKLLRNIAGFIRIDLNELAEPDQRRVLVELSGILYILPWLFIAVVWLAAITDLETIGAVWPSLTLMFFLAAILSQYSFFQVARNKFGGFNYTNSNLAGIVWTSALFLFGPIGVWVQVLLNLLFYAVRFPRGVQSRYRLNWFRNVVFNSGVGILISLLTVSFYQWLDGPIPLTDLSLGTFLRALIAMVIFIPAPGLFFQSYVFFVEKIDLGTKKWQSEYREMTRQTSIFIILSEIPSLFGILAAAIYSQMGLFAYLLMMLGVLLVSLLARWLSRAVMVSDQRSQELDQMEQFSREYIAAPADASTLPALLEKFIPRIFNFRQIEIRLFNGETLVRLPVEHKPLPESFWGWFENRPQEFSFSHDEILPWSEDLSHHKYYIVPILSTEQGEPIGGICLVHESWYIDPGTDLPPGLHGLAAQIASALHGAEVYAQNLAHEKVAQELAFAGRIQASFLPAEVPQISGWDLAATLRPAKETSGDFYDFIPLPDGRWGLLVADVADKGMGAALVMAQARTLIRTYAMEYDTSPARALRAANERMLADSAEGLFVTVFYGVLDPVNGELIYSNAGHNPPLLMDEKYAWPPKSLIRTGVPLGILEHQVWEEKTVSIAGGGEIVLYSDGLVEAMDAEDLIFGEARLLSVLEQHQGESAQSTLAVLLEAVANYAGDISQFDDQTLMVVCRT